MSSIPRLGPMQDFLRRAIALNQLHNPDDRMHAYLGLDTEAWRALSDPGQPRDGAKAADLAIATVTRKSLASLHREFPAGAPVHEQAAYLLRGFAGLQPFALGSDLTGWDLVAETLEHHGFGLLAESEDGREVATGLWARLREAYPSGFLRGDLLERDATFQWLAEWFRPRIVATGEHPDTPQRGNSTW